MPPPAPPVSVALPVHLDRGRLTRAVRCITTQTLRDLDVMIVVNGSDDATRSTAARLASADPRVRLLELPAASLPAALNLALREARHDLVARMDADDESQPTRLAIQAAFLDAHPSLVALGTAFEGVDEGDQLIGAERLPTEPGEIRWRLCLANCFCHGSMMLRRREVLAAGGYDESLPFAQDYDLWLRLSRRHGPPGGDQVPLANLPHILYRYRTNLAKRHQAQARAASGSMIAHWSTLPPLDASLVPAVSGFLAESTWGGQRARSALASLEDLLTEHGPSPQALLAWQVISQRAGVTPLTAADLQKLDRVREAGRRLRSAGVGAVWLYGAGRHTSWLLENRDALGVGLEGITDDALAGSTTAGFRVHAPRELPPRCHVLLSSDAHEEKLWQAAAGLRQRGITVWRLHTRGDVAISASGISPPGLSIGA